MTDAAPTPAPREQFERRRVGSLAAIVGAEQRVVSEFGDHEILTLSVRGTVYAISNVCTHARGWLDPGEVYADTLEIECPLHVGRFSLTTGEATLEPCAGTIRTYAVAIDGDEVFVEVPIAAEVPGS